MIPEEILSNDLPLEIKNLREKIANLSSREDELKEQIHLIRRYLDKKTQVNSIRSKIRQLGLNAPSLRKDVLLSSIELDSDVEIFKRKIFNEEAIDKLIFYNSERITEVDDFIDLLRRVGLSWEVIKDLYYAVSPEKDINRNMLQCIRSTLSEDRASCKLEEMQLREKLEELGRKRADYEQAKQLGKLLSGNPEISEVVDGLNEMRSLSKRMEALKVEIANTDNKIEALAKVCPTCLRPFDETEPETRERDIKELEASKAQLSHEYSALEGAYLVFQKNPRFWEFVKADGKLLIDYSAEESLLEEDHITARLDELSNTDKWLDSAIQATEFILNTVIERDLFLLNFELGFFLAQKTDFYAMRKKLHAYKTLAAKYFSGLQELEKLHYPDIKKKLPEKLLKDHEVELEEIRDEKKFLLGSLAQLEEYTKVWYDYHSLPNADSDKIFPKGENA